MENISIAVRTFNERVRTMNQSNGKQLVLSPAEARSLHTDIFSMLANIAELSAQNSKDEVITVDLNGGKY